jgi:hypothetical protein
MQGRAEVGAILVVMTKAELVTWCRNQCIDFFNKFFIIVIQPPYFWEKKQK